MIRIDLGAPVPLVEQIEDQLRRALAAGELQPGEPLPPVRQLAGDLGVNLNTVARAYRALEAQGLIRTQRGRGTVVTPRSRAKPGKAASRELRDALDQVLSEARLKGFGESTMRGIFEASLRHFWQQG